MTVFVCILIGVIAMLVGVVIYQRERAALQKEILERALMGYIDLERKYEAGEQGAFELAESYEMDKLTANEKIYGLEAEVTRYKTILEWHQIADVAPPDPVEAVD